MYAAGIACAVTGSVTIILTSILLQWKHTDISSIEISILVLEICSFFNVIILTICLVREHQTSCIEWHCGPIPLRSCLCIFILLSIVAKSGEMAWLSETMLGECPTFYDEQLLKATLILQRVVWTVAVFFQGSLCTLSLILSNIRSNRPFSCTSGALPSSSDPLLKPFWLGPPCSDMSAGRLSDGVDEISVRLASPASIIHSTCGPPTQNKAMTLDRSSSHRPRLSRSLDSISSNFNASERRYFPSRISSSASIFDARGMFSPNSHQSKNTVIHVTDQIPRMGSPLSSSSASASELPPQLSSSPERSKILDIQTRTDSERATAGFYLDPDTLYHPQDDRLVPSTSASTNSVPNNYSRWSATTESDEVESAATQDEMQGCRQSGSWPVQFRSRVLTASLPSFMTRASLRNSLLRFYKREKDDSGDDGNMC